MTTNPHQAESDAMAAFLAARKAGVSLDEQGKLWAEAVKQEQQHMQEKVNKENSDANR